MLPQSLKKKIDTLRQTTGRYPSDVFVPNCSNTSFVNKLCPIFSKNNILTPVLHAFRLKHPRKNQLLITTDEFIKKNKARHKQMLLS